MTTSKKRGRPLGSSAKNAADEATMQKMAVEMVTAPEIAPTAALKRLGITEETEHRRLTRKWKVQGPRFLQAEKDRRAACQPQKVVYRSINDVMGTAYDPTMSDIYSREIKRITDRDAELRRLATTARMHDPFSVSASRQLIDQLYSPATVAATKAMNEHLHSSRTSVSLLNDLTKQMMRDRQMLGLDPLSRLMRGF